MDRVEHLLDHILIIDDVEIERDADLTRQLDLSVERSRRHSLREQILSVLVHLD